MLQQRLFSFICFTSQKIRKKIRVRIYLILFYIERGLHSRTEIGEREINGSTVHSSWKQDIIYLFASPLPPFHNLIRGAIGLPPPSLPPFTLTPPYTPTPLDSFEAAAVDLEDGL